MNKNRFEGDPKLTVDQDGWDLTFLGGQPVLDRGFENMTTIALLTKKGWVGNIFFDENEKIGSNVREKAQGAITISTLNDIRQEAEKALKNPAYGKVISTVTNPESNNIILKNLIQPPGRDIQELILTTNGQNWINQAQNPAYRRIN